MASRGEKRFLLWGSSRFFRLPDRRGTGRTGDADSDATIQFFNSIGTSVAFLTLSGSGFIKDDFFSFSGLNGVTRVVFTPNDPAGLGYDDFTFDSVAAVPVPAALPLFLSGLLVLGVIARRRKNATA